MESYKRQKIIKIVREIGYSGNKYQINGIVLTKAIFFIKKGKELFKLIANGDYTITTEGTNTFIVINNTILDGVLSLQIGYELNTLSGKYEVNSDPDINILKEKYNTLVDDFKNLWDYVQKQTLVSDTLSMELILPRLEEGETWIYKDNEMKATPLIVAEAELQKLLDKLVQNSQGVLDSYTEVLKINIEDQTKIFFADNKKEFLNKTEIRKEINYVTGTEYKETNIFGIDLKSIVAGETYYNSTKPYMAIKTAYNSNGFLAPDTENFIDITNKNLNEEISELKGSYYAPINSLVGTFPISGWVNWVAHDSMATHVMIVLEVVGVGIGSYPVPLKALRWGDYHYHIECSSRWFIIRNHNGIIQVNCPSNGTEFQAVKLVKASFYK